MAASQVIGILQNHIEANCAFLFAGDGQRTGQSLYKYDQASADGHLGGDFPGEAVDFEVQADSAHQHCWASDGVDDVLPVKYAFVEPADWDFEEQGSAQQQLNDDSAGGNKPAMDKEQIGHNCEGLGGEHAQGR